MKTYLLLQVPGWVLGVLILVLLQDWFGLPFWMAAVFFLLWVAKDLAMYPFIRTAYESNVKTGVGQLISSRGVARERLEPQGYVQLGSELWRAEVEPGHQPILPGSPIMVRNVRGLTLIVTTVQGSDSEHLQ